MPPEEIGFHLAIRSEIDIHAPREIVWDWLYRPQEWKPSIVSLERLEGAERLAHAVDADAHESTLPVVGSVPASIDRAASNSFASASSLRSG